MGRQHHHRCKPEHQNPTSSPSSQRNCKKENPSKSRPFLTSPYTLSPSFPYLRTPFSASPSLPFPCQLYQPQSPTPSLVLPDRDPDRGFLHSSVKYRESADGLTVTAIFDLPRVKKDDMHVSFQGNRLVVSWRTVKITEREEPLDAEDLGSGTRILRELEHKKYSRTIPLPDGTKVCSSSPNRILNSNSSHLISTAISRTNTYSSNRSGLLAMVVIWSLHTQIFRPPGLSPSPTMGYDHHPLLETAILGLSLRRLASATQFFIID